LAHVVGVKTAVALTIVPNIVMDALQLVRQGDVAATLRRWSALLAFGTVGTVLGTRLLVSLPPRVATLVLGGVVLLFVGLNATRLTPRVPARWRAWVSPPVGFVAGVVGGLTNVPGTPLVMLFYALGLDKTEFVRAVALTFMTYKLVQLGAVAAFGLLTWPLLLASLGLAALGLVGFGAGLRIQSRLDQRTFNRAVLACLAALGASLVYRSL
ncbi:MAG TPA: sulfite exporter TauE/SafE family protein, partial [Methylomirabilota bacterium]|nr:sulfite exporter TauE/SafE family protein [Methylomirabilota bacterium]